MDGRWGVLVEDLVDIVIMSWELGSGEVGIYGVLVMGGKLGKEIDCGVGDIRDIVGSGWVVWVGGWDVGRVDVYG